jgi:nucleotide-binding universal stress UspA family protein
MIVLQKILVATDFSEPSQAALAHGREFARLFGAQLTLVHVVQDTLTRAVGGDGFVFNTPDRQACVDAAGKMRVDALLNDEDRTLLRAQGLTLTSNAPAAAIVAYATRSSADLIVVGTHGRGGLAHALLGSVAERVVRLAPCPVLTVRSREIVQPSRSPWPERIRRVPVVAPNIAMRTWLRDDLDEVVSSWLGELCCPNGVDL